MPGLDLSRVSSNWKKLQEKLQADKNKEDGAKTQLKTKHDKSKQFAISVNGVKRKRVENQPSKSSVNGNSKRTKLSTSSEPDLKRQRQQPTKPVRNMGLTTSKPSTQPPSSSSASVSTSHASLTTTHDISASDLHAAYGSTNGVSSSTSTNALPLFDPTSFTDTPNGGLVPNPAHKAGKYIAIDCEMVGTGEAPHYSTNILARVSVVNFHGEQIYDSYVIPPADIPVKDYRTRWSGIQPHHLLPSNGARSFSVVQRDISDLITGRVIVGHALRNDLRVLQLKVSAGLMRDTSSYSVFRKSAGGRAPALRVLAEREVGWRIQESEEGHSSLEDARAAMMVFRKVRLGLESEMKSWAGGLRGGDGAGIMRVNGNGIANGVVGKGGDPRALDDGENESSIADEDDFDEDELDDDEFDSVDGEAGATRMGGVGSRTATSTQKTKKKRKKKKRTKRN